MGYDKEPVIGRIGGLIIGMFDRSYRWTQI